MKTLVGLLAVALILSCGQSFVDTGFDTASGTGSVSYADWWNTSCTHRRILTFDTTYQSSATDLTDFPVLVSLSSSNIDYSLTQNDGSDLRFIDADASTELSYEIERWNESGTSVVWVKVPTITGNSNADYIYMYYGGSCNTVGTGQSVNAVWTSFFSVWHLSESSTGAADEFNDSTSNAKHGQGGEGDGAKLPAQTAAQFGFGQTFGTDDFIGLPASNEFFTGANQTLTMSAWVNPTSFVDGSRIMTVHRGSPSSSFAHAIGDPTDDFAWYSSGGSYNLYGSAPSTGTWYHYVVTYDGTNVNGYVNGSLATGPTATTFDAPSTYRAKIGSFSDSSNYFNGLIDELRFTQSAHSAAWIQAEYRSGIGSLITYGSQQEYQ